MAEAQASLKAALTEPRLHQGECAVACGAGCVLEPETCAAWEECYAACQSACHLLPIHQPTFLCASQFVKARGQRVQAAAE